ncbi:transposase [Paraburkholderia lacunae]|uniref:Transposase n=1 Tax=Paraburkholderia lacunae TaxID=2211104 RepID=A0A370NE72_9BURK|nr:transposase [Paraburkholderia lacunae]RDK03880.1 transposase [Paraburkholderia lacunae]
MFFDELSNEEWALLAALVSDEPAVRLNRRGRPRAEPRIVANAVLWILTTGEPWSRLPARYPSGPTCRRRFEEWQLNGTLLEMVRLLSQTGRTFAYVPQPAPPVAAKPAAPVAAPPSAREDSLRGVSWKSPESWQAPGVANRLSSWRSADPIADMTRQLSGVAEMPPVPSAHAGRAGQSSFAQTDAMDAMDGMTSAAIAEGQPQQSDDQRSPLSMSLAPRGTQVADRRGYMIYVVAEQVPNAMYRAWAEIMKDGKRVERSGLVGPRFAQAEAAEQYALDWARQWIDRECRTLAAAGTAPVVNAAVPVARPSPARPLPASPLPARPLPSMRQVPEPVTVNHGAPLHGPLGAFRGPLRRYPGEPAATATAATESSASDRFPAFPELISHAG